MSMSSRFLFQGSSDVKCENFELKLCRPVRGARVGEDNVGSEEIDKFAVFVMKTFFTYCRLLGP